MSASEAESQSAPARAWHRPGERHDLTCGPMVHGGTCLAHLEDGATVLVEGAIPGERVGVELRQRVRRAWLAQVVAVLDASPHRVVPPCPYVPECGGCDLQHVAHPHQLELKREIVLDALRRARVDLGATSIATHGMADPWHYRWRGEFHVFPGEAGLADATLGFKRSRSWTPVSVERCLIHHRTINDCLPLLRELVRSGGRPGLATLDLTVGEDGEELLVSGGPPRALDPAALDLAAQRLSGRRRLSARATTLRWRDRVLRASPETFIQTNWGHMDVLYQRVLEALSDLAGRRVVDAYAGIGVLAVALAEAGAEVTCIEANRAAATLGVRNAELNGVAERVDYRAERVEEALPQVAAAGTVDAVVLDPPRAGCDRSVTAWLSLAGPPRVVYVSCDPATLARDLRVLVTSGPYRIQAFDLVDMFPQTHHIESVVQLQRDG